MIQTVVGAIAGTVLVSACHGPAALEVAAPTDTSFDAIRYHEGPLPLRAKIFLVAGGHDAANFAQEVVDQHRIWRAAGFAEDEIVCYWAKPTRRAFAADTAQYRSLAEKLRTCHRASPQLLRRHLETVARRHAVMKNIPFVYLYITSHGSRSVLADAEDSPRARVREAAASASPCERELLDTPAMVLGSDRAGGLHVPSILAALRAGAEPNDVLLTPASLQATLAGVGSEVPKIVVLQGCYSGGFIGTDGDPRNLDGLATLPSLTLLTAARHDRASFGCQTGTDRTEFGGAYNRVLARTAGLREPPLVDWHSVYTRTRARVERRERKTLDRARSHPRFFRSERHEARTLSSVNGECGRAPGG